MTNVIVPLMLACILVLNGVTTMAADGQGSRHEQVREPDFERLQERLSLFRQAFRQADVQLLDELVAPNYTHTNDRSAPLTREEWLEAMERRRADMDAGNTTISEFETTDYPLRISGNTAVATGVTTMRGTRGDATISLRINFTNVWAWNGEDWHRIAFHDTYQQLGE